MPIPIRSRRYDEDFYNEMRGKSIKKKQSLEEITADLFAD
jgi:hypothetical protein